MTETEAQETISSTGFLKWKWYLNWRDTKEFHRDDFYHAQISQILAQVNTSKKGKKYKTTDFIIDFTPKKEKEIDAEVTTQNSKNFWMALAGMGNKDEK